MIYLLDYFKLVPFVPIALEISEVIILVAGFIYHDESVNKFHDVVITQV